jgi:phosphatidylinositol glycan class N
MHHGPSTKADLDRVVLITLRVLNVHPLTPFAVTSLILPFFHALRPRSHYLHRLTIIFLAFGPLFIILTISYEGLFYFAIALTLLTWVRLEHRIQERTGTSPGTTTPHASPHRPLRLSDLRISLFFLYLLQSAFFSTGNIASISSFSLDAVYRLLPVFDPFSQGALLLLKLLAPFALVSANLGILTHRLRLRGGSLFAVVMAIGDYLTLRFFWEVRDEGSWLEIGESISMFVIASVLCVFVAGLEGLSGVFVKGVGFEEGEDAGSKLGNENGIEKMVAENGNGVQKGAESG